jgi:hypothetical protein
VCTHPNIQMVGGGGGGGGGGGDFLIKLKIYFK